MASSSMGLHFFICGVALLPLPRVGFFVVVVQSEVTGVLPFEELDLDAEVCCVSFHSSLWSIQNPEDSLDVPFSPGSCKVSS